MSFERFTGEELSAKTLGELRALCTERGIYYVVGDSSTVLIEAILGWQFSNPEGTESDGAPDPSKQYRYTPSSTQTLDLGDRVVPGFGESHLGGDEVLERFTGHYLDRIESDAPAENNPPSIITTPASLEATEEVEWSYQPDAYDFEGDDLEWSLTGEPEGMVVDTDTGEVTWTPAIGVTTSGEVTLSVTDGTLTATQTFTVTVSPA